MYSLSTLAARTFWRASRTECSCAASCASPSLALSVSRTRLDVDTLVGTRLGNSFFPGVNFTSAGYCSASAALRPGFQADLATYSIFRSHYFRKPGVNLPNGF